MTTFPTTILHIIATFPADVCTASYERSFRVPHDLEPQDVDARYENGVLTVTLPKKEAIPQQEAPRQITVN